jgi:hypothetical protein
MKRTERERKKERKKEDRCLDAYEWKKNKTNGKKTEKKRKLLCCYNVDEQVIVTCKYYPIAPSNFSYFSEK